MNKVRDRKEMDNMARSPPKKNKKTLKKVLTNQTKGAIIITVDDPLNKI
jgi:hypothetical protein